jgi:8-oxo-dGTP diphosphatase
MNLTKQIGIAIVEHHGRYLVGVRGPHVPLAGFAEFPGGKCNADESPIDGAVRECFEESGLRVVPIRLLQERQFEYSHGRVELHFVLCQPATASDVRDCHNQFRWESFEQLKTRKFPEGNSEVIEMLGCETDLGNQPS